MQEQKRMVDSFEIIHSVHIGDKEVVFGIDEISGNKDKYFCGYCTANELFERYDENVISADYLQTMELFCDRVKKQIEQVREVHKTMAVPPNVITPEMCFENDYSKSIVGKVVAIKQNVLRNEHQNQASQLYYITGGFGSEANARGSACFGINIYSGKNTRWERRDIQGELKPECTPDWVNERLIRVKAGLEKSKKDRER